MNSTPTDLYGPPLALLEILETLASECPSALGYTIRKLSDSSARSDLLALANSWGVEPQELDRTVLKTASALDRLERQRRRWLVPEDVIVKPPPTVAMLQLSRARRKRVVGVARVRRLEVIARKLGRVHATERSRALVHRFIGQPAKQSDEEFDIATWIGYPLPSTEGGS